SLSETQDENAYPGLYQGLAAAADFNDAWSNGIDAEDCNLAGRYFNDSSHWAPGITWSPEQELAALGKRNSGICTSWVVIEPLWTLLAPGRPKTLIDLQNCGVPDSEVWSETNPTGARCTLQDYMVNVFGRMPNGYAKSPRDNVGVPYGLKALTAGKITP